jgi:flagellar hook protein FlgE
MNFEKAVAALIVLVVWYAPFREVRRSDEGLQSVGKMLYAESPNSGQIVLGRAGNEGLGIIRSHTLELSNMDLAGEFVRMITARRGFQANSKVVTTTDEVLNELFNLKR